MTSALSQRQLAIGCTLGSVAVGSVLYWRWCKRLGKRLVISRLSVYPIKSCRGVSLGQVEVGAEGFAHDREYAVVRVSDGCVSAVSQRQMPQLSLVMPELPTPAGMMVRKDGMQPLVVPAQSSDVKHHIDFPAWEGVEADGYDMGDEAAAWFNKALGCHNLRLVRFTGSRSVLEKYGGGFTRFADGFSLLLTSEASLKELGVQSGLNHIAERMRPNVVVAGCAAYEEDSWPKLYWERSGIRVLLTLSAPCSRCNIPRVHPFTGELGPDPLVKMKHYRSGRVLSKSASPHQAAYEAHKGDIFFGQSATSTISGATIATLRSGDLLSLGPL